MIFCKSYILIILLLYELFYCMANSWAAVTAQVDASAIELDQLIQFTIIEDNPQAHHSPDWTPLMRNFIITGTEHAENYSVINGVTRHTQQWSIALSPKQTGKLVIPALRVGADTTRPIPIYVRAAMQKTAINNSRTP